MRKTLAAILALTVLFSVSACAERTTPETTPPAVTDTAVQPAEPVKPTNKMTDTERSRVQKRPMTLLDPPEESAGTSDAAEYKVSAEFETETLEKIRENIENERENMTDTEYAEALEWLEDTEKSGEWVDKAYLSYVLVDGVFLSYAVPYKEFEEEGGTMIVTSTKKKDDDTVETVDLTFHSLDEYIAWIRQNDAEYGYTPEETERTVSRILAAHEALLSGNYETLPEGTIDPSDPSLWEEPTDKVKDYRENWDYDRTEMESIKDFVDEISIYDEETDMEYLAHVTLPPEYDKEQTYPVFFMTDAVWRFGNCPALRKAMEDKEAAPVILVTLGYNYHIDGADETRRYNDLVIGRDKLLDFITDNLMPYLCENYRIDCENSTFFGHSDGGVFAHYALFKSDLYENQPFGRYIIGSPALWGLYNYNEHRGISSDDVLSDYGYFDRNEKLSKSVFLCAGSQEDPDYADQYNGRDTTLEGVAKLKERLESHSTDLTYKLYDSHHYQYVPEMLLEYLKATYPYTAAE